MNKPKLIRWVWIYNCEFHAGTLVENHYDKLTICLITGSLVNPEKVFKGNRAIFIFWNNQSKTWWQRFGIYIKANK